MDHRNRWGGPRQQRAALCRGMQKHRQRARVLAESMAIEVVVLDAATLRERALDNFARDCVARYGQRAKVPARPDLAWLDKLTVNFIRHGLTLCGGMSYGDAVRCVDPTRNAALLHARVLDAIALAYPALAGECERQREGKSERVRARKAMARFKG